MTLQVEQKEKFRQEVLQGIRVEVSKVLSEARETPTNVINDAIGGFIEDLYNPKFKGAALANDLESLRRKAPLYYEVILKKTRADPDLSEKVDEAYAGLRRRKLFRNIALTAAGAVVIPSALFYINGLVNQPVVEPPVVIGGNGTSTTTTTTGQQILNAMAIEEVFRKDNPDASEKFVSTYRSAIDSLIVKNPYVGNGNVKGYTESDKARELIKNVVGFETEIENSGRSIKKFEDISEFNRRERALPSALFKVNLEKRNVLYTGYGEPNVDLLDLALKNTTYLDKTNQETLDVIQNPDDPLIAGYPDTKPYKIISNWITSHTGSWPNAGKQASVDIDEIYKNGSKEAKAGLIAYARAMVNKYGAEENRVELAQADLASVGLYGYVSGMGRSNNGESHREPSLPIEENDAKLLLNLSPAKLARDPLSGTMNILLTRIEKAKEDNVNEDSFYISHSYPNNVEFYYLK